MIIAPKRRYAKKVIKILSTFFAIVSRSSCLDLGAYASHVRSLSVCVCTTGTAQHLTKYGRRGKAIKIQNCCNCCCSCGVCVRVCVWAWHVPTKCLIIMFFANRKHLFSQQIFSIIAALTAVHAHVLILICIFYAIPCS